jgi:hypothetical protein
MPTGGCIRRRPRRHVGRQDAFGCCRRGDPRGSMTDRRWRRRFWADRVTARQFHLGSRRGVGRLRHLASRPGVLCVMARVQCRGWREGNCPSTPRAKRCADREAIGAVRARWTPVRLTPAHRAEGGLIRQPRTAVRAEHQPLPALHLAGRRVKRPRNRFRPERASRCPPDRVIKLRRIGEAHDDGADPRR